MSSTVQMIMVYSAIVFCYIWISVPALDYYSPQLIALVILSYFIIKRISKSNWFEIAPKALTAELSVLTIGFLIFIATTGNMESLYFPLSYIYLFFLVLALRPFAAICASLGVVIFHYALTPTLTPENISTLLSLPLLLTVFLFSKKQYEHHLNDQHTLTVKDAQLGQDEYAATLFIRTFLKPKLEALYLLSLHPELNQETMQEQIKLIHQESDQLLSEVQHDTPTQDHN